CSGDGAGPASPGDSPSQPNETDPMKIGNTDVPKATTPIDVSDLGGANFPQANATTFETATALEGFGNGSGSGPPRGPGLGVITTPTNSAPQAAGDAAGVPGLSPASP